MNGFRPDMILLHQEKNAISETPDEKCEEDVPTPYIACQGFKIRRAPELGGDNIGREHWVDRVKLKKQKR